MKCSGRDKVEELIRIGHLSGFVKRVDEGTSRHDLVMCYKYENRKDERKDDRW